MPVTGSQPQSEIRIGQRFSRGVVLRLGLRKGRQNRQAAELRCDCGATYTALLVHLRAGLVKSCGCLRRETCRQRGLEVRTHGLSGHPLYSTWYLMIDRCENPASQRFRDYGGRGITVFGPWHDVGCYIDWIEQNLGPRPGPGYSLDRADNDGNYEPGNLDWATPVEQYENTSRRGRDSVTGRFTSA